MFSAYFGNYEHSIIWFKIYTRLRYIPFCFSVVQTWHWCLGRSMDRSTFLQSKHTVASPAFATVLSTLWQEFVEELYCNKELTTLCPMIVTFSIPRKLGRMFPHHECRVYLLPTLALKSKVNFLFVILLFLYFFLQCAICFTLEVNGFSQGMYTLLFNWDGQWHNCRDATIDCVHVYEETVKYV